MTPNPGLQELAAQLQEILAPLVTERGLYLDDVQVTGGARRPLVRVIVDLPDGPGGVTADQLAEASQDVSTRLDEEQDLLTGSYLLEVTTPGLGRDLTTARHFRRAEGHLVTITTETGTQSGRVLHVTDDDVVLAAKSGNVSVPLAQVVKGRIDVEFRPAGGAGK